jgi:hypothetical protein
MAMFAYESSGFQNIGDDKKRKEKMFHRKWTRRLQDVYNSGDEENKERSQIN